MAVSRSLRFQVLRRDGYRCHYCGATAKDAKLTVDHVTATALGGTDTADNLVTACEPCNGGKSATPADAALVAQVQENHDRFQAAVGAVGEDDRERREFLDAFYIAWDLGVLPPGWAKTIDAYRQQGLAPHMWDEIIGIARAKTSLDDPFRYCCGIARNQVKKIQEQAAKVLETPAAPTEQGGPGRQMSAVRDAAFESWLRALGGDEYPPSPEEIASFRQSLAELDEDEFMAPGRIVAAADHAGGLELADIKEALRDMDHRDAWNAWMASWPTQYVADETLPWGGKYIGGPDDETQAFVKEQIDKLLDAEIYIGRIQRAATYAGFHTSGRLYRGLTDDELQATGMQAATSQALELWRVAYKAGYGEEPSAAERAQFFQSVRRVTRAYANDEHGLLNADLWQAAAWSGAYQDADLSTCLPIRTSVFEAAAALPVPPLPD
jgi:hypothetical protein